MAQYKTCPDCGAHLDPGERCDCKDTHCKKCEKTLKWGAFAVEQEICWSCFRDICATGIHKLENQEERKCLEHAMAIVAEKFGEEY